MTAPLAYAETENLINFDLRLAGYQLGMTYDDALSVRPLMFIPDTDSDSPDAAKNYFDAYAEQVYVDGIEMYLWVRFKHEKIYKVFARFAPENSDKLTQAFNQALGAAEDKSKYYSDRDGNTIHQTVLFWDYPTAKMYLVKNSDNEKYATIGLTAKPSYAETFADNE